MDDSDFHIVRMLAAADLIAFAVEGEIDVASAPLLRAELEQVEPDRHVILDLSGVTFMDSTGLKLFVDQLMLRRTAGGSLQIRNSSACVHRLIEICGLDSLLLERSPV